VSHYSTPFAIALNYHRAGLNVLPIRASGFRTQQDYKRTTLPTWKPYETRRVTEAELTQWFCGEPRGIAIIGGAISGNLEAVDLDSLEMIDEYFALIDEHAPGLRARLVLVETPRGGRHLVYRCAEIGHNQKLALRPKPDDPRKADTLIETRGEGGYFLAPGSPASCHPTGREYQLLQGSFEAVPTITPQERDILLGCARSLNEYLTERAAIREFDGGFPRPEAEALAAAEYLAANQPASELGNSQPAESLIETFAWARAETARRLEAGQCPDCGVETSGGEVLGGWWCGACRNRWKPDDLAWLRKRVASPVTEELREKTKTEPSAAYPDRALPERSRSRGTARLPRHAKAESLFGAG
jgi:hypothetical protein